MRCDNGIIDFVDVATVKSAGDRALSYWAYAANKNTLAFES